MKNIAVRSLVLALAVIGFSATSFTTASASRTAQSAASKLAPKMSMLSSPAPLCPPGSTCGLR